MVSFYSYVNRDKIGGSWKDDGCSVSSSNATHTECTCDHFTHFGVLMQLEPEPEVIIEIKEFSDKSILLISDQ